MKYNIPDITEHYVHCYLHYLVYHFSSSCLFSGYLDAIMHYKTYPSMVLLVPAAFILPALQQHVNSFFIVICTWWRRWAKDDCVHLVCCKFLPCLRFSLYIDVSLTHLMFVKCCFNESIFFFSEKKKYSFSIFYLKMLKLQYEHLSGRPY